MIIDKSESDGLLLRDMSAFLAELVRILPAISTSQSDGAVESRLFQTPYDDESDNSEWSHLVHDELRDLFASADEIVKNDLRGLVVSEEPEENVLEIPLKHKDAWLSCLNRARLIIATKNHLGDEQMSRQFGGKINSPEDMALFQIHFYGIIMENLLSRAGE